MKKNILVIRGKKAGRKLNILQITVFCLIISLYYRTDTLANPPGYETEQYILAMLNEARADTSMPEIPQGLAPLMREKRLDKLADSLNAHAIDTDDFSQLSQAADFPVEYAATAGYAAAKAGIFYKVAGFQLLVDSLEAGMKMAEEFIEKEQHLMMEGTESLFFSNDISEVGIGFSGHEIEQNGVVYYSYVLTIVYARPGVCIPFNASEWISNNTYNLRPELPVFDARYYLEHNPDLLEAFGYDCNAAIEHWQTLGAYEGREASPVFNARYYLEANPDLAARYGRDYLLATAHWLQYGIREGRAASPVFNAPAYLASNPDLTEIFGWNFRAATLHYINQGIMERRIAY